MYFKMAFIPTRMCIIVSVLFLFQKAAGESIGNWGPWGECSKTCNGQQTRTRACMSSSPCGQSLEDKRECSSSSCFSLQMIIALAIIGAAIVAVLIVIIALLFKIKKGKSRQKHDENSNMTNAIERMYDDAISTRSYSMRHFPSADSFPEPLKEPEEIGLDSFAFDTESLDESIREVSCSFGADEEYQPQEQPNKERIMSLKVVSVTETQAIDKGQLQVTQEPPPIYAVVVKPPKDVKL